MKLLHTADWHLGKRLEHISRLEEQREVLEEICEIAEREAVDAVLIAGDLFDHVNPSIEALELFYRTLKRLANDGKRAVIGIAGNHDSPDRIEAPDPLARECGIILTGYPASEVKPFRLESGLEVLRSAPGFIEVKLPEQEVPLRVLLTPYANEMRLRKFLGTEDPESELRQALQDSWSELAAAYCDDKGVNVLMAHLFFMKKGGEQPEEPEDERTILSIGGAKEVFTENLPAAVQYVALGHLHRKQVIAQSPCPVIYSGSPLAYSMAEAGQEKYVSIIEAEPGQEVLVRNIALEKGKQLARKSFDAVEDAVDWLRENPDMLVELTLVSDQFLTAEDRKSLYQAHSGIVALIPKVDFPTDAFNPGLQVDLSKELKDLFVDYFQYKHGQEPNDRIMDLLKEVLSEEEES